jgi:hypothetical protein
MATLEHQGIGTARKTSDGHPRDAKRETHCERGAARNLSSGSSFGVTSPETVDPGATGQIWVGVDCLQLERMLADAFLVLSSAFGASNATRRTRAVLCARTGVSIRARQFGIVFSNMI